jgi:rhamnulokinase
VSRCFLAFDLGAESGRAMLGRLRGGVIDLREVHRFGNEAVRQNGSLQWDILRIWQEMRRAFDLVDVSLESVGVDTWGVDYALLGENGNLLENPYHYRDTRTEGMMDAVFKHVSRERIYSITGIQFLPINTLFQLYAACVLTPRLIDASSALVTIPDLLNYWLTGSLSSEYTVATTTQFIDARTRSWATRMLDEIGLPTRLLQPLTESGSIVGPLLDNASPRFRGTPVVAPACHDTASAVASVAIGEHTAFLSSGTWSLLGSELPAPIISSAALELNFTNEGGVAGTTRLLKNIGGLWLLQACRRRWAEVGEHVDYDALVDATDDERLAFRSLIDPDHRAFLHPDDMPATIAEYCRQTGQPEPAGPPAFTRTILESLAFKYRAVLESLEQLTGRRFDEIRIVGGGARNRLLRQWTADATGRTVVAGPIEATALGNLALQMLATGAVSSLADARAIIDRSFPVERYEPVNDGRWETHYRRFRDYVELTCA